VGDRPLGEVRELKTKVSGGRRVNKGGEGFFLGGLLRESSSRESHRRRE